MFNDQRNPNKIQFGFVLVLVLVVVLGPVLSPEKRTDDEDEHDTKTTNPKGTEERHSKTWRTFENAGWILGIGFLWSLDIEYWSFPMAVH